MEKSPLNPAQKEFLALIAAAKWSDAETARRLSMTRSAISQIRKGKNTPNPQNLELLRIKVMAADSDGEPAPPTKLREIPKDRGGAYWGTTDLVPVVSRVSAGNARAWEDEGHDAPRIRVNCKDPNCYVVEVWGESMEPVYHAGDLLVIAPNSHVSTNDLVVFKTMEDEPYFKKYLGQRKGIHRFASFHPEYPVMEMRPTELRKIHPVHSIIRPLKGKIF